MDDTELDLCFRKHSLNSLRLPFEPVNAGYEAVVYVSVLEIVEYG